MDLPFPNPTTYPGHSGVDFPQPTRALVRASGRGVVTRRGWINGNAGYGVIVAYTNGPVVLYCHFPDTQSVPEVGAVVNYYDVIGTVGTTGRSTGPHLHMEIMSGNGAHTYAGVFNYFTRTGIKPVIPPVIETPKQKRKVRMYIANVNTGKNTGTFLITPHDGQPDHAVALARGAKFEGFPVVDINAFPDSFWDGKRLA